MKHIKVKKFGSGNDHLLIISKPRVVNRVIYFLQSYDSIIARAVHDAEGVFIDLTLDSKIWDLTRTTAKHRNDFLGRFTPWAVNDTNNTTKRISTGDIVLEKLNSKKHYEELEERMS